MSNLSDPQPDTYHVMVEQLIPIIKELAPHVIKTPTLCGLVNELCQAMAKPEAPQAKNTLVFLTIAFTLCLMQEQAHVLMTKQGKATGRSQGLRRFILTYGDCLEPQPQHWPK